MPCGAVWGFYVPLVQVDIGLLADQVRVATTNTLDSGHGVHYLLLTINIGVEETKNILKERETVSLVPLSQPVELLVARRRANTQAKGLQSRNYGGRRDVLESLTLGPRRATSCRR